jgi:hypothetical protein
MTTDSLEPFASLCRIRRFACSVIAGLGSAPDRGEEGFRLTGVVPLFFEVSPGHGVYLMFSAGLEAGS